jgi:molybdate transport system substrate-binding protein
MREPHIGGVPRWRDSHRLTIVGAMRALRHRTVPAIARTTGVILVIASAMSGSVLLSACGRDDAASGVDEVTVFAASSLTDAFTELGDAFTATEPDVDVVFNFAASSELAAQLGDGAPADVFASADTTTMDQVVEAGGTASAPVVFATNRAEIIVEAGNPEGIASVADLTRPGLIVVSCAADVPCGRYAQRVLDAAAVTVEFSSFEANVRSVVSKVTLGEADAGIVYATDVLGAGDAAAGVDIPTAQNVVAEYPIAVTTSASAPDAAQAFVDFVNSDQGRAILARFGFGAP